MTTNFCQDRLDPSLLREDPTPTAGAGVRRTRSAVTNGARLFVERPGDTGWHRRFRDVLQQILGDISTTQGDLSEGQRQLARRAATLSIACERMEGEAAAGAELDFNLYGQMTDRLGRCFQRLGLERKQHQSNSNSFGNVLREDLQQQRNAKRAKETA